MVRFWISLVADESASITEPPSDKVIVPFPVLMLRSCISLVEEVSPSNGNLTNPPFCKYIVSLLIVKVWISLTEEESPSKGSFTKPPLDKYIVSLLRVRVCNSFVAEESPSSTEPPSDKRIVPLPSVNVSLCISFRGSVSASNGSLTKPPLDR